MVGGGPGAFIGAIHRTAALMDGHIDIVCGAFSSSAEKSKEMGDSLQLDANRVYGSFEEMIEKEAALPESERMDFVSIVTPNHLHFEPARLALEKGFHVVMDKPMTYDLPQAKKLKTIVEKTGKRFCLTHTYTGYPLIKEGRQMIANGMLGKVRKVFVTYPQGWLHEFLEQTDQKQASWRTDPLRSGIAGAMGDIGTHAFHLAEYMSGTQVSKICAAINIVVEGRQLDDDGAVLLQFENGATGVLVASQVLSGAENTLSIQIYGEKGGMEWKHTDPNSLHVLWPDKPMQVFRAGTGYLGSYAQQNSRTPSGHPEGFIEAFANHYRNFARCLQAEMAGKKPEPEWLDYPGVDDGVRGMAFIENVIASGKSDKKWTPFTV